MQRDFFEYFAFHGHNGFMEDCTITLIDQSDGTDTTRREEYWRKVLKTVSPYLCLEILYSCTSFIHFSKARELVTLNI